MIIILQSLVDCTVISHLIGQMYGTGSVTELAGILHMVTGSTRLEFALGNKFSQVVNIWIIELSFRRQKEWTSKQSHSTLICLTRLLCPGNLIILSLRNSKATCTIVLFGSIQNWARTVDCKFQQEKINIGGGSASLSTSSGWDISIGLKWFFILLDYLMKIAEVLYVNED